MAFLSSLWAMDVFTSSYSVDWIAFKSSIRDHYHQDTKVVCTTMMISKKRPRRTVATVRSSLSSRRWLAWPLLCWSITWHLGYKLPSSWELSSSSSSSFVAVMAFTASEPTWAGVLSWSALPSLRHNVIVKDKTRLQARPQSIAGTTEFHKQQRKRGRQLRSICQRALQASGVDDDNSSNSNTKKNGPSPKKPRRKTSKGSTEQPTEEQQQHQQQQVGSKGRRRSASRTKQENTSPTPLLRGRNSDIPLSVIQARKDNAYFNTRGLVMTRTTKNDMQHSQSSSSSSSSYLRNQSRGIHTGGRMPPSFLDHDVLRHALLTKTQERRLGRVVQRAQSIQEQLQLLLAEKEQQRHEQRQLNELEWRYRSRFLEEEYDDDDDDNSNQDDDWVAYGFNGSPDMTSLAFASLDDELRMLVRTMDTSSQQLGDFLHDSRVFQSMNEMVDAGNNEQAIPSDNDINAIDNSFDVQEHYRRDLDLLTDQEVHQRLGISGGRVELRSILWQGARAKELLITSNMKLVVSIAKRWARMSGSGRTTGVATAASRPDWYRGSWDRPSLHEAIQEGVLGLATAAERFDPERGLRFSTYATHWITSMVRVCFQRASTGCLRLPPRFYDVRTKFRTLVKDCYDQDGTGLQPDLNLLAKKMSLSPERLQTILTLTRPLISTDAPRYQGKSLTISGKAGNEHEGTVPLWSDVLEDMDANPEITIERSLLRQTLENAMATELQPYERDVVRLRLGLDDGVARTCREVAQEIFGGNLSIGEVSSAEKRALKKLRSPRSLATHNLLAYLDFAGVDGKTLTL